MRILIISKAFPPRCNAQSLQSDKVSQAIAKTGCDVKVIAGKKISNHQQSLDHFPIRSYEVQYIPYTDDAFKSSSKALPIKIWRRLLQEHAKLLWRRKACDLAQGIVKKFKPHLILTLSTPIDSHRVGLYLKHKTSDIAWIASFSDPWPPTLRPSPYNVGQDPINEKWDMWLSRKFLQKCDAVLMPSKYALQLVEKKTNIHIKNKSWSIPHIGFKSNHSTSRKYAGWLVHIGDLGRERVSKPLLTAIKEISSITGREFKGLLCVGSVCLEFQSEIEKMRLNSFVKITGKVPQEKAVEIASSASALLVIEADMEFSPFLPSKFADYAIAKRPIIAITPQISSIRDYLLQYGGGRAVGHNSTEIASAIRGFFSEDESINQNIITKDKTTLSSQFCSDVVGNLYIKMFQSITTLK